jgi:superfamily I DNA/RNA helicase
MRALSQMRLIRRAVVLGGAGTGKTLLAREKTRRLAKDGFRTLSLCYNSLLGSEMTNELRNVEGVTAATFHSVCVDQARRAGLTVPGNPSQDWWEVDAPRLLAAAARKNATQFDAVVVDEGQDFAKGWFEVLMGLCSSPVDSPFYIFADNHQDLYCRSWWCPEEWPRFVLDINCRNSRQISKRVCAVYGDEDGEVGADGPETAIVGVRWDRGGFDVVQHTVARLLSEERLRPDQIVVLSDSTAMVEELRSRVVDDYSFTSWSKRGVAVETIGRFKGLEADAVVLMLSDEIARDANRAKALCYVGLSRARSILLIARSERISALGGLGS